MFRPHIGDCKLCPRTNVPIVVKSGACDKCNHKKKQDKKRADGKKVFTGISKHREPTGEQDVFLEVLDDLDDSATRCFVCGIPIPVVTHNNFSHILSKAPNKYPNFKLYHHNIKIMCHSPIARLDKYGKSTNGCHSKWDTWPTSELMKDPDFDKVFALKEELIKEYKQL